MRKLLILAVLCSVLLAALPAMALNARNFPGNSTTDYLTSANNSAFDFVGNNRAFLVLLKPANFTLTHVIAAHGNAGVRGWDFDIDTSGRLRLNAITSGAETGTVSMSVGNWYAVMFYKANGAGGVTFKIMPMATQSVSSETINTGSYSIGATNVDFVRVGNWLTTSANDAFAGVIQRIAYVNTSVSDADFKTWANDGTLPSGTVTAWSIQGDSPEQDLGVNNLDLTVTGTTTVAGYSARRAVAPMILQ